MSGDSYTEISSQSGDSYTEISSQGWSSRLGNALLALPFGLILFLASFVVLFWNEGRTVRTAKALAEGNAAVISIPSDRVDAANEGKLVHISGEATTDQMLEDPRFHLSARAIRLRRLVKMYQWREQSQTQTRKKLGGGEERITTYTYSKDWSDRPIDSGQFKKPDGHHNPRAFPFEEWSADAGTVKLGAFRLPARLVSRIDRAEPLPVGDAERDALPADLKDRLKVDNGRYYLGEDPAHPKVGDVTVEFQQVRPTTVSLLAQQAGDSFQPFQTRAGDAIDRLQVGTATADAMFQAAVAENHLLAWGLRLVGFFLMATGIGLVLGPLAVFADVIPWLGSIVRGGTWLIASGVALVLSLVTIALGWIAYRPVIGIAVFAAAGAAFVGFTYLVRGRRRAPNREMMPGTP
ncbi:MAG: TMEM43 family protein [Planctomycetaceae bacterium]|nr:TMEM43 family protein [Planctomycetaceae bacterium]